MEQLRYALYAHVVYVCRYHMFMFHTSVVYRNLTMITILSNWEEQRNVAKMYYFSKFSFTTFVGLFNSGDLYLLSETTLCLW